ncbi:MAG: hypothetical protein GC186_16925 [Rhodobacteraceae bacterium]|nr:hypothetical protein [Paracoccaceae bacterium]
MPVRVSGLWFAIVAFGLLAGCVPALLDGTRPDGSAIHAMFYPGGGPLKDLLILDGTNYFGKAEVSATDPLADVKFRLETGQQIRAACRTYREAKDEHGEMVKKCTRYEVVASGFAKIPKGSVFKEPQTE